MQFIYDDYVESVIDFESDAIEALAYNRETEELFLEFQSGGEYIYKGVAESTYEMFKSADSLGTFYRNFISGKYTSEKVDVDEVIPRNDAEDEEITLARLPEVDEAVEAFGLAPKIVVGSRMYPVEHTSTRARSTTRFGIKYQIAGTGIIAESEIEASEQSSALTAFYALFASELPGHTPVVIALTQYF